MSEWIEVFWDDKKPFTAEISDAVNNTFNFIPGAKKLSQKVLADMLFDVDVCCKGTDKKTGKTYEYFGGRFITGVATRGKEIRMDYNFDFIERVRDLCNAILAVKEPYREDGAE